LQKHEAFLEANPEYGLVQSAVDILIQKENRLIKWNKRRFSAFDLKMLILKNQQKPIYYVISI